MNTSERLGLRHLLWIISTLACLHANATRLLPVDEAYKDPGFLRFRAHLLKVIERRDAAGLRAVLGEGLLSDFGPDGDKLETFEQEWRPDDRRSPLWPTLSRTLRLGGSFVDAGHFCAPYVYSRWPDDLDAYEHVAATGRRVLVHEAPRAGSRIVARLDHSIVPLAGQSDPDKVWTQVRSPNGSVGFVRSRQVRSPIDFRACFGRSNGRWKMTAFVAGD